MKRKGVVYILTNPVFPPVRQNWVGAGFVKEGAGEMECPWSLEKLDYRPPPLVE